ncbi:hypothetical protein FJ366_01470 [Candidatus Dependentiae bacterium]|nr:hypothetical protein [Candidatus Dependentiae bacterium]
MLKKLVFLSLLCCFGIILAQPMGDAYDVWEAKPSNAETLLELSQELLNRVAFVGKNRADRRGVLIARGLAGENLEEAFLAERLEKNELLEDFQYIQAKGLMIIALLKESALIPDEFDEQIELFHRVQQAVDLVNLVAD